MWSRNAIATLALWACACTAGGPDIDPIGDQVVAVGHELSIAIVATSPNGAPLLYRFDSNLPGLDDRASIVKRPDGSAVFRFRPSARDIGAWVFDFHAFDDNAISTESIVIDVRSAIGNDSIPVFRSPLGAGTVLGNDSDCVELDIEISDQDSTEVMLDEQAPGIAGAELVQTTAMTAIWRWCPSAQQRAAADRHLLTLIADDGDNPAAIKRYQIITRDSGKLGCTGTAPIVDHTARDLSSLAEIDITVDVADDIGIKSAPLLYYSTTTPADPPQLDRMVQATMVLEQGHRKRGRWVTTIPNPVAQAAAGQSETVYYVVVAEDDDDQLGDCDHMVQRSYQMTVTSPGGTGGQTMCEPCSSDSQCGDTNDLCLRVGVEGDAFCMAGCTGDEQCAAGAVCSAAPLTSIDGAAARQCVPLDQTCSDSQTQCRGDALEPNDRPLLAYPIGVGTTDSLTLCNGSGYGSETDWYRFEVTGDSMVELTVAGAPDPDIDLALFDEQGELIALSWAFGSNDRISSCLPAGHYWLRAFSLFAGDNQYSLTLSAVPGPCSAQCTDDGGEPDDGPATATYVDLDRAISHFADRRICSGDDDWYELYMFAGETVRATMDFTMAGPAQDLDLLVYDGSGTAITRCSETEPWHCTANGQSGSPGEELSFTPDQSGRYYLVVHGWDEAENDYDLCVTLGAYGCLPSASDVGY